MSLSKVPLVIGFHTSGTIRTCKNPKFEKKKKNENKNNEPAATGKKSELNMKTCCMEHVRQRGAM